MPDTQGTTVATIKRSKFSELLGAIGDGTLEQDLSDQIVRLTDTLRETGGEDGKAKGSLKLTIKFGYDRGLVDVDSDVAIVEPKIRRTRTVMYPIRGGGLSRQNPQQIDAFTNVPAQERETRDIAVVR